MVEEELKSRLKFGASLLVHQNHVRKFARENCKGTRVSFEFMIALHHYLKKMLIDGIKRAKGERRSTVLPRDL